MSYKVICPGIYGRKERNLGKEPLSPRVCSVCRMVPSLRCGLCQLSVSSVWRCSCQTALVDREHRGGWNKAPKSVWRGNNEGSGEGRATLTQCKCRTPHSWESFAETLTFKENIWGSLLQEINFMVFLSCIYKKLERILSRQRWSGERALQLCWLHKCFACAALKEQRRTKGGKKPNTKPFSPLIFQTMRTFPLFFV